MRLIAGGILGSGPERGVVARYLDDCRLRGMSDNTVEQRGYVLARYERAHGPLLGAEPDDLRAFLQRRGNTLADNTKAVEHSHLHGFFKWALLNGHLERDPMVVVPRPKVRSKKPRPISEPALAHAVFHAPDRIRPWLLLAACNGLRAQEVAAIRGEDIRWTEDPPILIITAAKGDEEGAVPLHPAVAACLEGLPRHGFLFRYLDGRPGPVRPNIVSTMANRYLRSQGIPDTFHSLRHRFATKFYAESAYDLRLTQEAMRHKSSKSTEIYTWVDQRRIGDVVARLPAATLSIVPPLEANGAEVVEVQEADEHTYWHPLMDRRIVK